ncbi:acyl-CoA thioesterase [Tessaracoccus antarcticus]|uniref:Acyl-CoA thioesterase II n=1 Tax=Tessaracoccus antarcticus TaxID=2479848 RepID=A0A3M0G9A9_9ACTN|nr:acyl-CoA thioesterase II [Tessaracoccus antarcticus]RMB59042.1 acyl-CoA thioesterase II [Tessaracoccus antarcticus]
MPQTVDELISLFELTQTGEFSFRGPQPRTLLQRLFGGQVLAQSLMAAMHTVSGDRVVHSLNAYFLLPGDPLTPLTLEVEVLRDGRSFSARRVVAKQGEHTIFQLSASFHTPEPGLSHSAVQSLDVSAPEDSRPMREVLEERFGRQVRRLSEWDALDVRLASPPEPSPEGGIMRAWVRTQGPLPDDPGLHAAVLAYLSDITLLSVSTVQHQVEFMSPTMRAASIDHAMWFHRPFRADEWLLYDMVSPSASGARGFCTGRLFQGGLAVASCAQEGLIRVVA